MAQVGLFPDGPSGQPQNVSPKVVQVKQGFVSRTDTTTKNLFVLPKFARVLYVMISGNAVSNAGTTATISVGQTNSAGASSGAFAALLDVKGATGAQTVIPTGQNAAVSYSAANPALYQGKEPSDSIITAIYAETGTVSTLGGPWTINVFYTTGEFGEV